MWSSGADRSRRVVNDTPYTIGHFLKVEDEVRVLIRENAQYRQLSLSVSVSGMVESQNSLQAADFNEAVCEIFKIAFVCSQCHFKTFKVEIV